MNVNNEHPGNTYLFEIATTLVMYAKECLDPFNKNYAPLRMLKVIVKLADFPQCLPEMNKDPFLEQFKQQFEEARVLVMNDPDGFQEFMNRLVDQFVDEMQRRIQSD